jgi:hypothetical protein
MKEEQKLNESQKPKLNISDVSDSELFELKLTKDEVLKLKRCLSSLYRNYTPDGGSLSFASQLEDKLSEFLK